MNTLEYKLSYRRALPHFQLPGATFFVTFRLAGSIPQAVLEKWAKDTRHHDQPQLRSGERVASTQQELERQRHWFREFEQVLGTATSGPCWLRDRRIARLVSESLHHRDGNTYQLDAYCIMPNHVHVVFMPLSRHAGTDEEYHSLASILQSLKRYTAQQANRLLGRHGRFWQPESYDHCIRDEQEWERTVRYVLNNPVKAGLVDDWQAWEWNYCRYESL